MGAASQTDADVAFLILAHHEPAMLTVLLDRIRASWSHAFVHVDRKADRKAFEDALAGRKDCTLLPAAASVAVHWAGYSMVEATLRLLRASVLNQSYRRFVLLSGVDLPIKSLADIRRALDRDIELIRVDRELDPQGNGQFDRCANRCFLGDNFLANPRSEVPFIPRLARKLEWRLRNTGPAGLTVYYGPSWWGITRSAAEDVLAFDRDHPAVMSWFRRMRSPDEMVFQTIIKNGPRSKSISYDLTRGDPDREPTAHGTHYVDWTRPNPHSPRTLTLEDLPRLAQSEALFARKFDRVCSAELIAALQQARPA